MKVYFVRHGESVLTESKHQLPDSPLSDLGRKQAESIAKRFKTIPIDQIISSSYTRALQTAQEIEKVTAVPLLYRDLLVERKMPSTFLGKATNAPEIVPIHEMIREHFYESDWHYADEENFTDLMTRAKKALDFIHSQEKENVVVVTHGYFLTVLVFYILFGENIDLHLFKTFRDHTKNSNTGVTLCEYGNELWKLVTWNDISHLID